MSARTFSTVSRCRCRTLERSRIGKLHIDEDVALVFIGQEARGQTVAEESRAHGEGRNHHQSQRRLSNEPAAEPDIDFRAAPEHAIEPVKELAEQPVTLHLGPEHQPCQRRAQRESVKGGEDHRDGDGDGKLLVEPSGDAGDEGRRHKDRGENQGNTR